MSRYIFPKRYSKSVSKRRLPIGIRVLKSSEDIGNAFFILITGKVLSVSDASLSFLSEISNFTPISSDSLGD